MCSCWLPETKSFAKNPVRTHGQPDRHHCRDGADVFCARRRRSAAGSADFGRRHIHAGFIPSDCACRGCSNGIAAYATLAAAPVRNHYTQNAPLRMMAAPGKTTISPIGLVKAAGRWSTVAFRGAIIRCNEIRDLRSRRDRRRHRRRLAQSGADVIAIARGPHLDAMRARGLTLEAPGETLTQRIAVAGHPSEIAFGPDDVVLLTMKTQHTEAALEDLRAAAGDGRSGRLRAERRRQRADGPAAVRPRLRHARHPAGDLPRAGRRPEPCQHQRHPRRRLLSGRRRSLIAGITAALTTAGLQRPSAPRDHALEVREAPVEPRQRRAGAVGLGVFALRCRTEPACRRRAGAVRDEAVACYRAAGIDWASDDEMNARRQDALRLQPIAGKPRGGGSIVAEHRPRRRVDRDRLPQRRDRAARPPARRPDARERRHAAHRPAARA